MIKRKLFKFTATKKSCDLVSSPFVARLQWAVKAYSNALIVLLMTFCLPSCSKNDYTETDRVVVYDFVSDTRASGLYYYTPEKNKRVVCDLCGEKIEEYKYDQNGDKMLQKSEIERAKVIYLPDYNSSYNWSFCFITSYLRDYTYLEHLFVEQHAHDYGDVMAFDLFGKNLRCVNLTQAYGVGLNGITWYYTPGINLSNSPNLEYLKIYSTHLMEMDVTSCPILKKLIFRQGHVIELDLSNNKELTYLDCYSNDLTYLNISNSPDLEYLDCRDNVLYSIDIGENSKLVELYCDNNKLTTIDISSCLSLETFSCSGNSLTTLYISKQQQDEGYIERVLRYYPDCEIIIK